MHNKDSLRIPAQYGLPGLKFNGNWWETWKIEVIYFFFSLKQKCKTCFLYDIDRETVTCNKGVLFCLFKASKRWAWSARHEHNAFFGYVYLSFRRSYTGRFATTVFSATQRCNAGTMLQRCLALIIIIWSQFSWASIPGNPWYAHAFAIDLAMSLFISARRPR